MKNGQEKADFILDLINKNCKEGEYKTIPELHKDLSPSFKEKTIGLKNDKAVIVEVDVDISINAFRRIILRLILHNLVDYQFGRVDRTNSLRPIYTVTKKSK